MNLPRMKAGMIAALDTLSSNVRVVVRFCPGWGGGWSYVLLENLHSNVHSEWCRHLSFPASCRNRLHSMSTASRGHTTHQEYTLAAYTGEDQLLAASQ
jgi:hypothetical protein